MTVRTPYAGAGHRDQGLFGRRTRQRSRLQRHPNIILVPFDRRVQRSNVNIGRYDAMLED